MKSIESEKEMLEIIKNSLLKEITPIKDSKWIDLEKDSYYQSLMKKMGIGIFHEMYIEVKEDQDRYEEYKKITMFIKKFMEYYANKNEKKIDDLKLTFINYGKTELVYVLTDSDDNKVTILVKQPSVKFGDVYEEMKNLISLKEKDKNVIAPIDYFQLNDQELYVTPYINQARCIASNGKWGMYIPEPWYRFEIFTSEQEQVVTICMIAKLVSLYDFERQEGIINCKLGGGDFILPKGWENQTPTIENTLENLYLIAARKKINCSYEKYLEIIRNEFSRTTINEEQSQLIINLRGRVPINIECINEGIEIGRKLKNCGNKEYNLINKT